MKIKYLSKELKQVDKLGKLSKFKWIDLRKREI